MPLQIFLMTNQVSIQKNHKCVPEKWAHSTGIYLSTLFRKCRYMMSHVYGPTHALSLKDCHPFYKLSRNLAGTP
jgi:hypothetical protein